MVLLEPLSYQPVSGRPVIFLAGPITAAPHWQPEAFDLIRGMDSGMVVASPRPFHSVRQYRYRQTEALRSFHRQRAWERYYMDLAARQGCLLFWLPGPRVSPEGLPYGATARFELGLWSSRWSRDPSLGLCVGGDPGFPTLKTLSYDLGKEMPGRMLHRSLEDTAREAVEIARENYRRWARAGSPPVGLESDLVSMSHEEHVLAAAMMAKLPGNPMNHPEALHREAQRLLKIVPDLSSPETPELPGSEELEELEDAEELEELEAVEASAVSGNPLLDARGEGMRRGMRETGSWFLAGRRVEGPRYLAVGLSAYCLSFLQRIAFELGAPVYQSDYLEWADPDNPRKSLAFFLDTAERIDINLEGIRADDLKAATRDAAPVRDDRLEPPPCMTAWEIQRLFHAESTVPVFWHTGGSLDPDEAFAILGSKVPREFIVED